MRKTLVIESFASSIVTMSSGVARRGRARMTRAAICSAIAFAATAWAQQPRVEPPQPPVAAAVAHSLEKHGHVRIDNYFWLKERDNPKVREYLEAENAYTAAVLAHTDAFQEKLYQEIVGRIVRDDASAPYRQGDYFYYRRFEGDADYPVYCRKKGSIEAPEEVMLDVNELAKGHEFFSASGLNVSSGQDILAFATDAVGRRFYTLRFKNLTTGELLPDVIENVTPVNAWAEDNRTLFYTKQHPETLRWYRIYRHTLGTDSAKDELVYEEPDETFSARVLKTKSKGYIVIHCFQTLSTEVRFLPADQPTGTWRVLQPRQRNVEYSIDHFGDSFTIRTNLDAKNFRLMRTPVNAPGIENWKEVLPHRADVFLQGVELFKDHLVISERKDGLIQLRIRPWDGSAEHYLDFGEPAYVAYPADNKELDTSVLRYEYTSLTTPPSTYEYDMKSRAKTLLKREKVLGGFDSANYVTERLWAPARDGRKVPIALVYRKDLKNASGNPLLLSGYGAYGSSQWDSFDSTRLSLIDRGFVFAIAHIRGGSEMGRWWYEEGKVLNKKNTFFDFIDSAEYLIAQGWTSKEHLYAMGGSAGGLLIGAVTNMRPDLFHGMVNLVPYVDAVTTMLDPDIPLTTAEYDEWGNPNEKQYYEYILSYSPYDNIEAKAYPNLLVLTGLHDSQVQYWEPAKYVAKLRAMKTDKNLLLLKINMEAGHGGPSGRFKKHRETALIDAFLLDLEGLSENQQAQ